MKQISLALVTALVLGASTRAQSDADKTAFAQLGAQALQKEMSCREGLEAAQKKNGDTIPPDRETRVCECYTGIILGLVVVKKTDPKLLTQKMSICMPFARAMEEQ